jgi:hypothetical protein
MLSIFTLSVLGAFGTANVLTDVTDPSDDDDHREDGLEDDVSSKASAGEEDLIERLDMYAALGMTPPPAHPHQRGLPSRRGCRPGGRRQRVRLRGRRPVADLTPEEFEMLSNDMAAAQLDAVDDGEPTEVISVAVGGPGAVTPNPTETGFRTQLGPGDELTLNIAPDLPGDILAVHSVFDLNEDDDSRGPALCAVLLHAAPGSDAARGQRDRHRGGLHGGPWPAEAGRGRSWPVRGAFRREERRDRRHRRFPPGRSAAGDRQPRP